MDIYLGDSDLLCCFGTSHISTLFCVIPWITSEAEFALTRDKFVTRQCKG